MEEINKKILIVDDDLRMDRMLTFLFESQGFTVRFSETGSNAIDLLQDYRPDIILLDLLMPEMDGFEVCERIKKDPLLKDIPIIVLSALPYLAHKERAFSLGVCEYIEKPFVSIKLVNKVKEIIEKYPV